MEAVMLIVNYNDAQSCITLLKNVKDYEVLKQIVVVDNRSSDDSHEVLKQYQNDKVHIIQNTSNKGYGSAINLGNKYIDETFGEHYIIVSNPDVEIEDEQVIIDLFHDIPKDAGMFAPIIKEHHGLNRGWKVPTPFQDSLLNIIGLEKFVKKNILLYPEHHYNSKLVEVEALSGCFFVISSSILKEAGYFDEEMFLYYEENVMSIKLKKIGKVCYINTSCEVFHNHSVSIDKNIDAAQKYRALKKSQLYFQDHYNDASFLMRIFLILTRQISYSFLKFYYLFK